MLSPPCPQVTEDVARCKPMAQSLDNVEVIACDYIMDSVVSGAVVCRVTHTCGVAVRYSCPPRAQDKGCREGSGMHKKQCSASAQQSAVAKRKGQALRRSGCSLGSTGSRRGAPSHSLDLMALPAPCAECLLVQPGLVHLVPAAQHRPVCQTCQVLPLHGYC